MGLRHQPGGAQRLLSRDVRTPIPLPSKRSTTSCKLHVVPFVVRSISGNCLGHVLGHECRDPGCGGFDRLTARSPSRGVKSLNVEGFPSEGCLEESRGIISTEICQTCARSLTWVCRAVEVTPKRCQRTESIGVSWILDFRHRPNGFT